MDFTISKKYSDETKKFVSEVIEFLESQDLAKGVDSCSLNMLCHYHEAFTKISDKISEDGYLIERPNGSFEEHPLTKKLNEIQIQLFKILQEYGLTPMSRKRLSVDADSDDDSPISMFLKP